MPPNDESKTAPGEAPEMTRDQAIAAKTKAGLTKDQAADVVDRQAAYDKDQKKAKK